MSTGAVASLCKLSTGRQESVLFHGFTVLHAAFFWVWEQSTRVCRKIHGVEI